MAHPRHEEVRERYHHCCGYCGVGEIETGGELTIDHFQPVSAGGDDSDDNLVYACFRDNTYKGDFWPSPADLKLGRRLLHPFLDDLSVHLRENQLTGRLEPLTPTGEFHLFLLRLNRPQLVECRLARRMGQLLSEGYRLLRDENERLWVRIVLLETYLREVSRQGSEEIGEEGEESP